MSLCACTADADEADEGTNDDESSSADSGDDSAGEALEIEGDWTDDFMGTHAITATSWTQTFGEDTFVYAIAAYDNTEHTLVAQDGGDDSWSKFQWTEASDDGVFYCQIAFGAASREMAEAAALADPADPANGGCAMFPWTLLHAAQ